MVYGDRGYRGCEGVIVCDSNDMIEEVGRYLASFKSVSHCYERSGWYYNLLAMIHGKEKEEVKNLVRGISQEIGLKDYALLFSTREFKKEKNKLLLRRLLQMV